jgi:heterodisulfide reductase subunit C1
MSNLYEKLILDVRCIEGLKACINCGTCTAICPAAEFYNYHPRILVDVIQSKNEEKIEELLKSYYIWYCGECMSCKTRCPRGNVPGLVVMALRSLSQDLGYFVESEKGRQQLFMKRVVGGWILNHGYCLYLEGIGTNMYAEQGPVWDWIQDNYKAVMERMGANYQGEGTGILRKIPQESLDELKKIFDVTGGTERFEKIEAYSKKKAEEMNLKLDDGISNEYFHHIYTFNNNTHNSEQS